MRRVLLGILVLLSCSCAQKATITKSEREKAVKIGNEAVVKLMREMKRNLGMALKKGGFPEAIKFCSSKAQLLAKKVNEELAVADNNASPFKGRFDEVFNVKSPCGFVEKNFSYGREFFLFFR